MTDDLARRAVACRHWRWCPGMLIQTVGGPTDRIAGIDSTYIHAWAESQQAENPRGMWIRYRLDRMDKHGVPDLTDPATLGCLLALVREAHRDARVHVRARANKFRSYSGVTPVGEWADTEAAALVGALEAAP